MSTPTVTRPQLTPKRKRYSEEFKINAVKLLEEGNRTQAVLAAELGISVVAAAFECARHQHDEPLAGQIQAEFIASRKTYDARRIRRKLCSQGRRHSRRSIVKLMTKRKLKAL